MCLISQCKSENFLLPGTLIKNKHFCRHEKLSPVHVNTFVIFKSYVSSSHHLVGCIVSSSLCSLDILSDFRMSHFAFVSLVIASIQAFLLYYIIIYNQFASLLASLDIQFI